MRGLLERLFGRDIERTIWVEEQDLGREKRIEHGKKSYAVQIPHKIDKRVKLRLRGLGRTRKGRTGDLLLEVWLNRGEDTRASLWLSESSARNGAEKVLELDDGKIAVRVRPGSRPGSTIRLRGRGRMPEIGRSAPSAVPRRGDLLVTLHVYPDDVAPRAGSFDALSTEDMAMEGWVYRKIDEVFARMGRETFAARGMQADAVTDAFNENGWRGVADVLRRHLGLTGLEIRLEVSDSIPQPGQCQKAVMTQNGVPVHTDYTVRLSGKFLDEPFTVAAIVAHELCHVVYYEKLDDRPLAAAQVAQSTQETVEVERTVDLLVFLFGVGTFQLRVARDSRRTLGYFHQEVFERMQAIASKKLAARTGT